MVTKKQQKQNYQELRRSIFREIRTVRLDHLIQNPKLISSEPGVYLMYRERDCHPYVGESVNVSRRLIQHATTTPATQYIDREIQKTGPEGFQVAFLERKPNYEERRKTEGFYVDLLNSYHNGFNGSIDGGRMSLGQRYFREIKQKILKKLFPDWVKRRKEQNRYRNVKKMKRYRKYLQKLNRR